MARSAADMSRHRKPRRIDPTAGFRAIARRMPMHQKTIVAVESQARLALAAILSGRGRPEDLHTLGQASNIALVLAEGGAGRECIPAIKTAQAALLAADERLARFGRVGFDGLGLIAVRELLDIYEQQIASVTAGAFDDAVDEVRARVEAGLVAREREEVA